MMIKLAVFFHPSLWAVGELEEVVDDDDLETFSDSLCLFNPGSNSKR